MEQSGLARIVESEEEEFGMLIEKAQGCEDIPDYAGLGQQRPCMQDSRESEESCYLHQSSIHILRALKGRWVEDGA